MKVYMVCDFVNSESKYESDRNDCSGRILNEDGSEIGRHHSSSFGWLRSDLRYKVRERDDCEIIDLIGEEVPERFKFEEEKEGK